MSILLEALRKSEKDRQKVETPNIHSDEQSSQASGAIRKEWLLLLIVVVMAGTSYAWYQYQKQDDVSETPLTQISGTGAADENRSVEPAEKIESNPIETGKDEIEVPAGAAMGQRTPVETYQQSKGAEKQIVPEAADNLQVAQSGGKSGQTNQSGKKPATSKQAVNNRPAGKPVVNKQAGNQPSAKKKAPDHLAVNQKTGKKPVAKKAVNTTPAASNQKQFRPKPPAPISYWELPDSIRANIPEMKFSVLVYAKDPADRFVLINGQRYRQGERVKPELFVREIRRKGVVFKYRLYKFLVER